MLKEITRSLFESVEAFLQLEYFSWLSEALRSECQASVLASTERPHMPTSFQVWEGMCWMWLAALIVSPRYSAQGRAHSGCWLDSVAWI